MSRFKHREQTWWFSNWRNLHKREAFLNWSLDGKNIVNCPVETSQKWSFCQEYWHIFASSECQETHAENKLGDFQSQGFYRSIKLLIEILNEEVKAVPINKKGIFCCIVPQKYNTGKSELDRGKNPEVIQKNEYDNLVASIISALFRSVEVWWLGGKRKTEVFLWNVSNANCC